MTAAFTSTFYELYNLLKARENGTLQQLEALVANGSSPVQGSIPDQITDKMADKMMKEEPES